MTIRLQAVLWIVGILVFVFWQDHIEKSGHAAGFQQGVEWSASWHLCVAQEERAWAKHYDRPADTMSSAEEAGIDHFCAKSADEEVGR